MVCSQVNGKAFCDCKASGGVCIKQELLRNGGKAKPGRMTYESEVISVIHHDGLVFFRVKVPLSLEQDLYLYAVKMRPRGTMCPSPYNMRR